MSKNVCVCSFPIFDIHSITALVLTPGTETADNNISSEMQNKHQRVKTRLCEIDLSTPAQTFACTL